MKPKFSIILNSYNPNRVSLHTTMACLAAIRKFTEPPYELIVVDNTPELPIRDDYHVLQPYKLIQNTENQTSTYSYHQGAQAATTDKLVFIQSDVFVHEKTINKLVKYLGEFDAAFPQQVPITRDDVEKIYEVDDGAPTHIGGRDEGMIAITKEAYTRCGGWDVRFKNMLQGKAFFIRWDRAGVSWTDHTNAFITHIMAGTNLGKDPEFYNEQMDHDAKLIKEFYE
jgi:GT2 family glycosyltransferase